MTPEQIAEKEEERKTRKKEIVMIVIGTFISLILTQIFADILDSIQRSQNRHMSALMVFGNIESFAVSLEKQSEKMGRNDTVGRWLLAQPLAYLDTMSVEELDKLINEALNMNFINRYRTAEKIFESTIDTWDNMDNVAFIDNAGQCFSQMNSVEVYWNDWVKETKNIANEIAGNSDQYPGTSIPSKYMHNEEMRHRMARIHDWRRWMGYVADFMRYLNKQNMQVIGVSDKELDAFIKDLADITEKEQGEHEGRPKSTDYYTPQLNLDSLNTMPPILLQ